MTSKGQVTVPKSVPDFLGLAGAVPVPPAKKGVAWSEIKATTWRKRAAARR